MPRFDNTIISRIQHATDIIDVVSEHVSLSKKGREMVGLCPFHNDHRPSMYVNPEKQIFKCFACGAGGDVFKFIQMRENLRFPEAVERLAERAGIELKTVTKGKKDRKNDVDPNRLAKANKWAAELFQNNLKDEKTGEYARNYIKERSISAETVENWQLGLADGDNGLVKAAKKKNADLNILQKAGLTVYKSGLNGYGDKFVNRLMFPIKDVTGRVIGFGGRTLDNNPAKYLNSPSTVLFDKSNSVYGLDKARHSIVKTGIAVVVEGYMDCIMAHQFGIDNVVAALGTSFTDGHARILRRYAKKVVLLFDSDVAGIEAANRALDVCLSEHIDIQIAQVPEGKDPCDYLLAQGKEKMQEIIDNAVDVFDFKWQRMLENLEKGDSHSDKKAALEEYLNMIVTAIRSRKISSLDKGIIINKFSKVTGLSVPEINSEIKKRLQRKANTNSYVNENSTVKSFHLGEGSFALAQREIIEVLLAAPVFYRQVKDKLTPKDFSVPELRQITEILFDVLDDDIEASTANILSNVESVELSNLIVMLTEASERKANYKERFEGALEVILEEIKKEGDTSQGENKEDELLKKLKAKRGKKNLRNTGMISK